eukprot:1714251-Rhodomonas_salina.1
MGALPIQAKRQQPKRAGKQRAFMEAAPPQQAQCPYRASRPQYGRPGGPGGRTAKISTGQRVGA